MAQRYALGGIFHVDMRPFVKSQVVITDPDVARHDRRAGPRLPGAAGRAAEMGAAFSMEEEADRAVFDVFDV
ncbi:hypothetical protein CGRA01v4_05884 [Colletotrichum graminicola]|nr:hypothetical protein CGRA01v4_05884 [Colletotrichum graminicola]